MLDLHSIKKRRYTKPKVVSKRIEFMTNTFGASGVPGAISGFGPSRQSPKR
jgi:hypothetical protein